jgi:hypothetical protein
MKQKVVSYKTALLLKQKGFNEPTEFCYWGRETSLHMIAPHLTNESLGEGKCSAPTIDEVRQWLKDKHGIYIEIKVISFVNANNIIVECKYDWNDNKIGGNIHINNRNGNLFDEWDKALENAIETLVDEI